MKHKKMIMITPEQLERLRSGSSQDQKLSRLDDEMDMILKQRHLDDETKWSLYRQTLDKYLRLSRKKQEPISIPIIQEKEPREDRLRSLEKQPTLFSGLPPPPPQRKEEVKKEEEEVSLFSPIKKRLRSARKIKRRPQPYENILKWTRLH